MKQKLFFLMLTLFVLGAASANAQVRIGGTDTPHTSAVLDLNADDAATAGSLGLALPRVELGTNLDELNGTEPVPGTIVYNSAATLEGEGVYVWTKQWGSAGGPVPVSGIFITNSRVNLSTAAGAALRLSAVVFPANATNQNLTWSIKSQTSVSGSGDVATIDPITGVLSGIQGGDVVAQVEALGGSAVLDEINVAVTGPAGSVTGLSGTAYDLYYFGENYGVWFLDNLKEGSPTYTGSAAPGIPQDADAIVSIVGVDGYYYGSAARASACPSGYRVPTPTEFLSLVGTFNNTITNLFVGPAPSTGQVSPAGAITGSSAVYYANTTGATAYNLAGQTWADAGGPEYARVLRCVSQ
jgi:hypothetical protein